MAKKNIFISHRWDYPEDYEKISNVLDRSKYDVSDRSVEKSNPIDGTQKAVTTVLEGKIDSASVILAPARPSAVTPGSAGRKEIDYAISKCKKIIAVDTKSTDKVASYWSDNNIPVVACRTDSIENAIG
jgi:hypothetical protein